MNYLKKLIWGGVAVFLCFYIWGNIFVKFVKAEEEYELERELIVSTYYVSINGLEKHLYHAEIFRLDGRVVYCVDLGTLVNSKIYNASFDLGRLNLDLEDLIYIQLYGYYGYEYGEHNKDYKYYLAAQELIWERMTGWIVFWTSELSYYGKEIDISSYKEEIVELVEEHLNSQISLDTISGIAGETIILEQEGLNAYEIVSSGSQEAFIEKDQLIVKLSEDKLGNDEIILVRKSIYEKKSTLYTYGTSQMLLAPGSVDFNTYSVPVSVEGSTIDLQRVDDETGLVYGQGEAVLGQAEYDLYRGTGEFIKHLAMDDSGGLQVDGLAYGEYYLVETKPSVGYELNPDKIPIIVDDSWIEVLLPAKVIKNEVELFKLFGDNSGFLYPEVGSVFSIYDDEMNFIDKITTGSDGLARIILPYGSYLFRQTIGKEGYALVDDFYYEVIEPLDNLVRFNLFDEKISCHIKIIAGDSDSGNTIISNNFKYRIKKSR